MRKTINILFVLIFFMTACTDKFEEYNTDEKNPEKVGGNTLFTNAQKELVDQISSVNVNRGIWSLWAQYWTETTYTDEANYDIINRNVPEQIYRYYYREALQDLKEAHKIITEEEPITPEEIAEKNNRLQIIEVLSVYAYQRLVDIFGAIPYSEALNIENVYPVYEDGFVVYQDLIKRLDAAIAALDNTDGESFGSADLFYQGKVDNWKKFAYSLKLKMGITIADYDETTAKTWVESALGGELLGSSSDDCTLKYLSSSPNQNPKYEDLVASGRDDFVPANTIIDAMTNLNDPRVFKYFTNPVLFPYKKNKNNTKIDSTFSADMFKGRILIYPKSDGSGDSVVYKEAPFTIFAADSNNGMKIYLGGAYGYSSSFSQHSHVNSAVSAADFPGLLMTYSEVLFYLAEAAERGFGVSKTAEEYYNEAIKESIISWGGLATEADEYIAQSSVAYTTAEGDWKQKIGTQSWIASYIRGLTGYTTWRRLDYPEFNLPPSIVEDKLFDEIPTRFTFPVNEQTLNPDNYDAAATMVGGDELTTKVFWDKF